jgi:tRNA A-37 threonylcarbamoyl transferase component Bud32
MTTFDRRIDTEVGGYRIVERIARGATSVVYRAEHVRLGRQAAVKLLAPTVEHEEFRERFLLESKLAASIDHPSIVPVYDAGDADGLLYIAMACVDGSDLRTVLVEEGRLPLRRALRIAGQIASALDAAHARGLVHRDVKPANILVGEGDRAYLSDFGVVKQLAGAERTRTGAFVGTIAYCAPEQIEGREIDGRVDQYSLACVLYEMLVGVSPFDRSSDVAVLNAHLRAAPPKLTKSAPDLPAALEPVLAKALSKSPLDRYGSCAEFVAAARAGAADHPVSRRLVVLGVGAVGVAAALGAGAALGISALAGGSSTPTPTAEVRTVVRTVQPKPTPVPLDALLLKSRDPSTLNDGAYYLINAGEYARAIPLARKALELKPKQPTVGYANFNLGFALLHTGRCAEALPLLERALKLEVPAAAPRIRPWITRAQACLRGGASSPAQSQSVGGRQGPSRAR